ncbi:MAG: hydrogenase/urease maturation nickel metallochaperone HypA [Candidatus Methanoplasma sp.]|nr:hydrogenase/urease maturation nickel metallochaperone HypA [Candidatus Methanoplasma sp.]
MHEVSIVSDLVSAILKELEKYNAISVAEVTFTIGKLTNLGHDQMEFAYNVITRGTILEGSKLIIEDEEIILECESCGYDGPADMLDLGEGNDHSMPVLSCPKCHGPVTVTKGQSCCVKNMCIEEEEV